MIGARLLALYELHETEATKTSTSACRKVLVTMELLEHILLGLPTMDLLLAQSVSRTWRNLITTSIALGSALSKAKEGDET